MILPVEVVGLQMVVEQEGQNAVLPLYDAEPLQTDKQLEVWSRVVRAMAPR